MRSYLCQVSSNLRKQHFVLLRKQPHDLRWELQQVLVNEVTSTADSGLDYASTSTVTGTHGGIDDTTKWVIVRDSAGLHVLGLTTNLWVARRNVRQEADHLSERLRIVAWLQLEQL